MEIRFSFLFFLFKQRGHLWVFPPRKLLRVWHFEHFFSHSKSVRQARSKRKSPPTSASIHTYIHGYIHLLCVHWDNWVRGETIPVWLCFLFFLHSGQTIATTHSCSESVVSSWRGDGLQRRKPRRGRRRRRRRKEAKKPTGSPSLVRILENFHRAVFQNADFNMRVFFVFFNNMKEQFGTFQGCFWPLDPQRPHLTHV